MPKISVAAKRNSTPLATLAPVPDSVEEECDDMRLHPEEKEQKQVAQTQSSGPPMILVRSEPYLAVAFRTAAAMAVRIPPPTRPETPCPTSAPASMPPAPDRSSASPGIRPASQVPPTPPIAPAMVLPVVLRLIFLAAAPIPLPPMAPAT